MSAWTVQYNANELPENALPAWSDTYTGSPTAQISPAGNLNIVGTAGQNASWSLTANDIDDENNYVTIEIPVTVTTGKSISGIGDPAYADFYLSVTTKQTRFRIEFYTDGVAILDVPSGGNYFESFTLDGTAKHTYRLIIKGLYVSFYIDGVLMSEGSQLNQDIPDNSPQSLTLAIGQSGDTNFNGDVDFIGYLVGTQYIMYSSPAYTYNEVDMVYNGYSNVIAQPYPVSLTLSLQAAIASIACTVAVNPAELLASIQSVTVNTTSNITVSPDAFTLTLFIPDTSIRVDDTVSVEAALVTSSVPAPTISTVRNVSVTPEVAELLLSALEVGISAVENLNLSITPQMVVKEQKGNGVVKDTILTGNAVPARIIAVSDKTRAVFEDNGLTYNEAGYTFNDSRATYGGSDRISGDTAGSGIVQNIIPKFIHSL